ncbi:SDR family oxidoreductase [Synechococcus sp. RSCCF101]|nr:SDR family oxidoreductase [Synechococcus sp. RSCCF101]
MKRQGCEGVLILGAGYCGARLARALQHRGIRVVTTSRSEPPAGAASAASLQLQRRFDPGQGVLLADSDLDGISHVLVSIPPDAEGRDPSLAPLQGLLAGRPLQWLGYLSTTGVYGDTGGEWVTEADTPRPSQARSQARLRAEQAWRCSGLAARLIRLPGIYGPGRSSLEQVSAGRARRVIKAGQVFSRVHVDDIVGALLHLMGLPPGDHPEVVNVADDLPCAASEVVEEAARLLGCNPPPARSFEEVRDSMSPMALSFWQDNRRVSNRLLRDGLGYRLKHPTYREGLRAVLMEQRGGEPVP